MSAPRETLKNHVPNGRFFTELHLSRPTAFLDRLVFRPYPREIAAVGFKLFYHQARTEPFISVWPYLRDLPGMKVIHLKRRNLLEEHASHQRARLTGEWVETHLTTPRDTRKVQIDLDMEECINHFRSTRQMEREADRWFSRNNVLIVYYEDLVESYPATMLEIQRFLGLEPRPLRAATKKQRRGHMRQHVRNYDEIRRRLAETEWACFVDGAT